MIIWKPRQQADKWNIQQQKKKLDWDNMIIWKPRQQADEINIPKTKNNKKHANQLDWDNMIEETTPTGLRDFFHNLTRFPPQVVRMLPRTSADHRSLPDTRPCLQWWCWHNLCLRTSLPSSPPAQTMSSVTACWVTWLSAEAHAESDRTRRPSNSINTEDTCNLLIVVCSVSIPLKELFNQLTAFVFGGSPGILFCRVSPHPITF